MLKHSGENDFLKNWPCERSVIVVRYDPEPFWRRTWTGRLVTWRKHVAAFKLLQELRAIRRVARQQANIFRKDDRGSLVMFSLFIFLAMLMFGGIAVDLMLYENRRTHVQNSTDRAVLAAANLNQTMALLAATRQMDKKFYVLCGEDALTFSSLCLGGDGAVAAVAHVIGKELHEMMQAFAKGDHKTAQDIHFRTLDIVHALFIETNPVPVKTALEMMGQPAGKLRLPLTPMRPATREVLRKALQELGKL